MMKEKYVPISINVSEQEREMVHDIARQRGYKITSDYIRSLIETDAKTHGIQFRFKVDRGGWRGERSFHKHFVIYNETANPKLVRHVRTEREFETAIVANKGLLQQVTYVEADVPHLRLAILSRLKPNEKRQQEILIDTIQFIEMFDQG